MRPGGDALRRRRRRPVTALGLVAALGLLATACAGAPAADHAGGDAGPLRSRARCLRLREPRAGRAPRLERRLRELLPADRAGGEPVLPLRPLRARPARGVARRSTTRLVREVIARPPWAPPADEAERVVIPGYADLRGFSAAQESGDQGGLRLERPQHDALAHVARRRRLPAGAPGAPRARAHRRGGCRPPGAAHDHELSARGPPQPLGPRLRSPAGPAGDGLRSPTIRTTRARRSRCTTTTRPGPSGSGPSPTALRDASGPSGSTPRRSSDACSRSRRARAPGPPSTSALVGVTVARGVDAPRARWHAHPYNRSRYYRLAAAAAPRLPAAGCGRWLAGRLARPARWRASPRSARPCGGTWRGFTRGATRPGSTRPSTGCSRASRVCFADLLSLNRGRSGALAARRGSDGQEPTRDALAGGRGCVSLTAHLGNWELAGRLLATLGRPVHVVMAPEEDPAVGALLARGGRPGLRFVRLTSPMVGVELVAALRRGEVVAFQLDRAAGRARGRVGAVLRRARAVPARAVPDGGGGRRAGGPGLLRPRGGTGAIVSTSSRRSRCRAGARWRRSAPRWRSWSATSARTGTSGSTSTTSGSARRDGALAPRGLAGRDHGRRRGDRDRPGPGRLLGRARHGRVRHQRDRGLPRGRPARHAGRRGQEAPARRSGAAARAATGGPAAPPTAAPRDSSIHAAREALETAGLRDALPEAEPDRGGRRHRARRDRRGEPRSRRAGRAQGADGLRVRRSDPQPGPLAGRAGAGPDRDDGLRVGRHQPRPRRRPPARGPGRRRPGGRGGRALPVRPARLQRAALADARRGASVRPASKRPPPRRGRGPGRAGACRRGGAPRAPTARIPPRPCEHGRRRPHHRAGPGGAGARARRASRPRGGRTRAGRAGPGERARDGDAGERPRRDRGAEARPRPRAPAPSR